ncbi:protease modulator HflK [Sedimentibacter sp. zth1]|uniref:protease modulator HflK n=1 Tax=Sedimentibacter sp. zth1 TaxID=2816908 RepID=UPI001A91F7EF|nr:protease modulator HflK [Sedimentibacter sp. zth1]QSX06124.1 protease modulator HflK [Sedimentibacter sp. zth1]
MKNENDNKNEITKDKKIRNLNFLPIIILAFVISTIKIISLYGGTSIILSQLSSILFYMFKLLLLIAFFIYLKNIILFGDEDDKNDEYSKNKINVDSKDQKKYYETIKTKDTHDNMSKEQAKKNNCSIFEEENFNETDKTNNIITKFIDRITRLKTEATKQEKDIFADEKIEEKTKTIDTKTENDAKDVATNLHNIQYEKDDTQQNIDTDKKSKAENIIVIAYLLILFFVSLNFIKNFYIDYPLKWSISYFTYSYTHVSIILISSCALLVIRKIFIQKKDEQAHTFISNILLISGVMCLITAVTISLNIMLKISFIKALPYIFTIIATYLTLSFTVSLVLSVIKKNVLVEFNYNILPFLHRHDINLQTNNSKTQENIFDVIQSYTSISLKSLWSLKYIAKTIPVFAIGICITILLATSLFIVKPYQNAIVYRFGQISQDSVVNEGLHFKFPWPIEKVEIYDVKRIKNMQIGYESSESTDFLWTQQHDGGEYSLLLGNGNELISINVKLMYYIDDLYTYLTNFSKPEEMLNAKAYEILMNRTINTTLDTFLTIDRSNLSMSLQKELSEFSKESKLGLKVNEVIIESIHPPVQIADVYQKVVNASIDKQAIITKAETEAEKIIIEAKQASETSIINAQKKQKERVTEASTEMAVYYAALEAYKINPSSFRLNKYLNTYEKIIKNKKVYVFSPNIGDDLSRYIYGSQNPIILNE